jgi:two-component system OmpR family sensor kinase
MQTRSRGPAGGLGLGLAIAARVASRHGGEIWVEDTPGGGATFCFVLAAPAA